MKLNRNSQLSNVIFELGPKFNRNQQVKVANNIFEENIINNHPISERQRNILQCRIKVVNEMNDIYGKMTNLPLKISKNATSSIYNFHEKYNEMIAMINSPPSHFFSTEIQRIRTKNKSTSMSQAHQTSSHHDKSTSSSLDFKCDNPFAKQRKPTIILLKGKSNSKSKKIKFNSPVSYDYNNIEFTEIRSNLPYLNEKMIKEELKKYEMKDKLLSLQKRQFKH